MPNHKRVPAKNNQNFFYVFKKHPVLVLICCIVLVATISTFIYRYYEQQKTLNELSAVSKDLKVIYDKILASQEGNVSGSNYRNECSVGNASWLVKHISCGTGGVITLKQDVGLEEAHNVLSNALIGNSINSGEKIQIYKSEYFSAVTVKLKAVSKDISCDSHYGESSATKLWSYSVSCRKNVPDFLPGYVIAE